MPELEVTVTVRLVRHPRALCVNCHRRRILYSLATLYGPETSRLCARCSGIQQTGG